MTGSQRRVSRRILASSFTTFSVAALCLLSMPVATSRTHYQGLLIVPQTSITRGQALACNVQLEGSPENITIRSNPPGAVSYSGLMTSSTGTVYATTASTISVASVTLYLETDGATTVSATVAVDSAPHDGPGGNIASGKHF